MHAMVYSVGPVFTWEVLRVSGVQSRHRCRQFVYGLYSHGMQAAAIACTRSMYRYLPDSGVVMARVRMFQISCLILQGVCVDDNTSSLLDLIGCLITQPALQADWAQPNGVQTRVCNNAAVATGTATVQYMYCTCTATHVSHMRSCHVCCRPSGIVCMVGCAVR